MGQHILASKIVAALMICGLYALTIAYSFHEYVDFDESIYLMMAGKIITTGCPMNVVREGKIFIDNPPLIPYFASSIRSAGVDSVQWIRILHITFWVLPGFVGIYLLAKRLFCPAAGILALIVFSTRSFFFQEAARVKLDVALTSLSTLFFLCLYEMESPRNERAARLARFGIACFGGLACLIKHQAILLPIGGLLYLLIRRRQRPINAGSNASAKWVASGIGIAGMVWLILLIGCWENFQLSELTRNWMRLLYRVHDPALNMPLYDYWIEVARRVLGPVVVSGMIVSLLLWRSRLFTDRRLLLLSLWFLLVLIFCSSIGLKANRYFILATPSAALLIASLVSAEAWNAVASKWKPAIASFARLCFVAIVVVASGYFIWMNVRLLQRPRLTYFEDIGTAIKEISARDERVLLYHPQVAFYAHRDFVLGQFAKRFELIYERDQNIYVYVQDSTGMFHPNVTQEERKKFEEYVQTHFMRVPMKNVPAPIYRRVKW